MSFQTKSKTNPFAALMADDSDDDQQDQQQQKIEIQVPRTPPTAPAPTQAPNAPIRKPYGWKPESQKAREMQMQAQAQKIIKEDEFPSLGRSTSSSASVKTGAWSNGVKSIHDAKDIVAPKPVLSLHAQKRLRYGAARRLLDGVAYVDAQFEGDVTIFFNNGQAQILEDEEDQEYEDQEYTSGADPEWEM